MAVKKRNIDLVARSHTIGNIRIADAKPADGKSPGRPRDTFRITSNNRMVLDRVAEAYGGEVIKSPIGPGVYEVITERSTIKGFLSTKPVGMDGDTESFSLLYEMYTDATTRMRVCNGETCMTWKDGKRCEVPCMCPLDDPEKMAQLATKKVPEACKLKARFHIMLSEFPCPHLWVLNTGSKIFMAETEGFINMVRSFDMPDGLIPVTITLAKRSASSAPGEQGKRFPVVAITFDTDPVNLPQQLAGIRSGALAIGPSAQPQHAIGSSSAPALPEGTSSQEEPEEVDAGPKHKAPNVPKYPGSGEFLRTLELTSTQLEEFKAACDQAGRPWGWVALEAKASGTVSLEEAAAIGTTTSSLLMEFLAAIGDQAKEPAQGTIIDAEFSEEGAKA